MNRETRKETDASIPRIVGGRPLLAVLGALAATLLALSIAGRVQAAEPAPAWSIVSTSTPTTLTPGDVGTAERGPAIHIHGANVGGAPSHGAIAITDKLPAGLTPVFTEVLGKFGGHQVGIPLACSVSGQTITCESSETAVVYPGENYWLNIPVEVSAASSPDLENEVTVSGGGGSSATTRYGTEVGSGIPPFGFLDSSAGTRTLQTNADGSAAQLAGSHPFQIDFGFGFNLSKIRNSIEPVDGGIKNLLVTLPRGLVVDPEAVPVHCTEAQLEDASSGGGITGCPNGSQVGVVDLNVSPFGATTAENVALYAMVRPGGTAAEFGFRAAAGVYVHLIGSVNSAGEFELRSATRDILSKLVIAGFDVSLWGDPWNPAHDQVRGACVSQGGVCPVEGTAALEGNSSAFLSLPSHCSTAGMTTAASAGSWVSPLSLVERTFLTLDTAGAVVPVVGCGELEFEPSITAAPTTNLTDSPTGLEFSLHQPQNPDPGQRATATLKEAKVTLPAGLVLNPSASNGLDACSEGQIGLVSRGPLRFTEAPQTCPNAAKIGTVEVTTPLLGHPLPGAVYLAKPFANPFGSLLAIYLAVEDPQSGVVSKLAGQVDPDPKTGQLTATFREGPELPLEDVDLHFFKGATAALKTPIACGRYSTTTVLTPWSTPAGADAKPSSSFQTAATPRGGNCPTSEAEAPNSPSFSAGTVVPKAGAFSPFVLKLSRQDGTQQLAGIDTVMPNGLLGRLAGIPYCSESQLAQVVARERPEEGALERSDPSCPQSSEVGTVEVGAGAGPTPAYVSGHVYLAGPYKGGPLSFAIVTPAVAGPFDLGAVLTRVAIEVDPTSARIRAISDPLPQILDGIPLDLKSVAVQLNRPSFTINPTNCDPMAVTGSTTSMTGEMAALSSPFQVGGCNALPFKPSLSIRLKGGTKRSKFPAVTAIVRARPGEAGIARAAVTLPHSEFLEQGHIGTVCTRVQFAAENCPARSVYGFAEAISPLLDKPLAGPVYLRSSDHPLPDLVAALRGQIEIDLAGRIDSVKGQIRTTFASVPDAPISKFTLRMRGGKKGLLVNSTNICIGTHRATSLMDGQNGKTYDSRPLLQASCKGGKQKKRNGSK